MTTLRAVPADARGPLPALTGEDVLAELAPILDERVPRLPLDDPLRGALASFMHVCRAGGPRERGA